MSLGKAMNAALAALALAFVFWPWVLGAIDASWWIATGHQLSGMPWASGRGVMAFWWPIACLLIVAFFTD